MQLLRSITLLLLLSLLFEQGFQAQITCAIIILG